MNQLNQNPFPPAAPPPKDQSKVKQEEERGTTWLLPLGPLGLSSLYLWRTAEDGLPNSPVFWEWYPQIEVFTKIP